MSRTWLAEVKPPRAGPPLRAHRSAMRRERSTVASMAPVGEGQDRRAVKCR